MSHHTIHLAINIYPTVRGRGEKGIIIKMLSTPTQGNLDPPPPTDAH